MRGLYLCRDDITIVLMMIDKEKTVGPDTSVGIKDGEVVDTCRKGVEGNGETCSTSSTILTSHTSQP